MSESRRTTLLAIGLLLLCFGGGLYVSTRLLIGEGVPVLAGKRVAVLPLEGVIVSEKTFLRQLERFRRNDAVKAFVLEIRSPGGAVGPSQSIYRTLRRMREEDDRPIVAWIGEVGASGGYYVALAADSIYALPGSLTGSIGVLMEFPNAEELLRKVGLEVEVVKSGEHKDLGSPTRPLSDRDREILEQVVRDVYEQFVDAVSDSRPLARERVLELADGRVFTGEQAVELRLIDGIGTLAEAVETAGNMAGLGAHPRTIRPAEREVGLFDLLRGVSRGDLRAWLAAARGVVHSGPRLMYEWR